MSVEDGEGLLPSHLSGKRCAVTGASSGIGEAIAHELVQRGAHVVGLSRRGLRGPLSAWPAAGKRVDLQLDVCDEDAVKRRFGELGRLDVLIVSAGSGHFASIARTESRDLRALLDVHVVGAFQCAREASAEMSLAGQGHIVAIGSIASRQSFPECGAYAAAKAGQAALFGVLTEELRPRGVRVTRVLAGAVDTPIWDARPGFDRNVMMPADEFAALIVDVLERPAVAPEEMVVVPPSGAL